MPATLTRADARRLLVSHHGLNRILGRGARGTRKVLEGLRCIQLDPLDVIGTNADLVVMARVDGVRRGDVWRHLFPKYAFEHFFKERCILPADAFPWYRQQGHNAQVSWWRHGEREQRVAPKVLKAVFDEIRARGPLTAAELTDHGAVEPIDWSGWRGTAKATSMAVEMLWTQCEIVVAGRTESGAKLYDVPRFDPTPPSGDFATWLLRERAQAAGLLKRPKDAPDVDDLIEVQIEGSARRYLAVPAFLEPRRVHYDDRVRILGPLDPLLWDRDLVRHVFEFDYVWEVYKPKHQRKWGWYVCPLLHRDRLIGRIDARIEDDAMVVSKLWIERETDADIESALWRHAKLLDCSSVSCRSSTAKRQLRRRRGER